MLFHGDGSCRVKSRANSTAIHRERTSAGRDASCEKGHHNLEIPISFITNKTNTMSDEYESVEEEVEDVEEDSEDDEGPKKKRREKKWKVR